MAANHIAGIGDYGQHLGNTPAELKALDLLIGGTEFFREPERPGRLPRVGGGPPLLTKSSAVCAASAALKRGHTK